MFLRARAHVCVCVCVCVCMSMCTTTDGTTTQLGSVGEMPVVYRALNLCYRQGRFKKRQSGAIRLKLPWKSEQRSKTDTYVDRIFMD